MEKYTTLTSSYQRDICDLSQECYSYMKIKQFLADRLTQQQEEIDTLRKKVKYYIARDVINKDVIDKLVNQLGVLKKREGSFSLCSEEAVSEDLEKESKENKKIEEAKAEDQYEEELIEEINKLSVDKFILFNELNELVMGLKRCNLDKLNELLMKDKGFFPQEEMPIINGLQLNVLSAESQLCKIIKKDQKQNNRKITQESINYYDALIKECEREFMALLEKKLQIHE